MGKFDTLKQASESSFSGLYIDNTISPQNNITEFVKPILEDITEEKKEKALKMVSYRIPKELADMINQYAYVERMTSQDVATLCIQEFFNKKSSIEVLSKYEEIKK